MGEAMQPLKDLPQFESLMIDVSNHPVLGVGIGTLLTMILQSSSATIGILQQLYSQGSLELHAALPILFGDNIGTTITAILASLGTSIAAKRTAASHVIFNLVGAIIFTLLLSPFIAVLLQVTDWLNLNPAMQIAVAHGMFNLANLFIQIWFINQIAALVKKIIPGKEKNLEIRPVQLAENLIYTAPSMAIEQAKIEVQKMSEYVVNSYQATSNYYQTQDAEQQQDLQQYEGAINHLDTELTEYLAKLATVELTGKESQDQTMLLEISKDMERIGDHCQNIIKLLDDAAVLEKKQRSKEKRQGKESARSELILQDPDIFDLFEAVKKNLDAAVLLLHEDDEALANKMMDREERVNQMVDALRAKYIQLMTTGQGRASDSVLFIDISSNLERCSDLTIHIAKYALDKRY